MREIQQLEENIREHPQNKADQARGIEQIEQTQRVIDEVEKAIETAQEAIDEEQNLADSSR